MRRTLRVATYNIHKCRGLDGRVRTARIVDVLRELHADIVALQEVLGVEGHPERDQARSIAKALGLQYCFGENRRLYGGAYGNVVLSRFPLVYTCNYDLSTAGRESRGCLRADIDLGDCHLHCFNVHLGTSFMERRQQGRRLVSSDILLNGELYAPRIVLGDFNEWTRGLTSRLLAAHLRSVDVRRYLRRSRTYPGIIPFLHLDHFYCGVGLELEAMALHRTRTALIASDHLPLVVEFRLDLVHIREKQRDGESRLASPPRALRESKFS